MYHGLRLKADHMIFFVFMGGILYDKEITVESVVNFRSYMEKILHECFLIFLNYIIIKSNGSDQ